MYVDVLYIYTYYILIYMHIGTYTFWGAAYTEVAASRKWRESGSCEKQKKKESFCHEKRTLFSGP